MLYCHICCVCIWYGYVSGIAGQPLYMVRERWEVLFGSVSISHEMSFAYIQSMNPLVCAIFIAFVVSFTLV